MSSASILLALVTILVLAFVSSSRTGVLAQGYTDTVCLIFYGAPGNVDYPWSAAILLNVNWTTGSGANNVLLTAGAGTRTYTNKFGTSTYADVTLDPAGTDYSDNYLYVDGTTLDGDGITYNIQAPGFQFPGNNPNALKSQINVYTDSAFNIVEQNSYVIDQYSSAFLSSITGFPNNTFPNSSNPNSEAIINATCTAGISTLNGGAAPVFPTLYLGSSYEYTYSISDGTTWSAYMSLTLTAGCYTQDSLGNYYQTITAASGFRNYYYPLGVLATPSTVTGLTTQGYPNVDQRFYALGYNQFNGVTQPYTISSAPYLDYDGISVAFNNTIFEDGTGSGVYPNVNFYSASSETFTGVEESHTASGHTPKSAYQVQTLSASGVGTVPHC